MDVWTLKKVAVLVDTIKEINPDLKCGGFVNRAFANSTDNDDTMAAISQTEEIDLIPLKVGDRKAFSNSFGAGLTVPEIRPTTEKAIQELQALYMYLLH